MPEERFRIVFEKLEQAMDSPSASAAPETEAPVFEISTAELDEISKLRKIVLETTEEGQVHFTST